MDTQDVPTMSAPDSTATIVMGPTQAGYQAQLLLFGIFFQQFVQYAQTGELQTHNRAGRLALWVCLVLNFIYTGFVFYESYVAGVSQDRTTFKLENGDQARNVIPLLAGLIAALTETFLAVRAGTLIPDRRLRWAFWVWMSLLISLVLAGSAGACAAGVQYGQGAKTVPFQWNMAASCWLWGSAVADISVSAACAFSLKSRIAGFNEMTDGLLRKLISIVVKTASYTAILSVVSAVLLTRFKDDDVNAFIPIAFWLPLAGCYGISLFTFSAGSRRAIDARFASQSNPWSPPPKGVPISGGSLPLHVIRRRDGGSSTPQPLQISVQHSSVIEYDEPDSTEEEKSAEGKRRLRDLDAV
ncbi:hypothetical protein JCM10213_008665 [Rhodosporidiobolus nylandii]